MKSDFKDSLFSTSQNSIIFVTDYEEDLVIYFAAFTINAGLLQ